jgi:histidine decarboxylase
MKSQDISSDLLELREKLRAREKFAIGIPTNLAAEYTEVMALFGDQFLNNIGDIFYPRERGLNSQPFEREVLRFFADLYKLGEQEWWGYMTPGSTEGNLSGLYLARQKFPGARLLYSRDSHYSLDKIASILRMESEVIPSLDHGEIDYDQLQRSLAASAGQAVVINLNIGTTIKGAIDDVVRVLEILEQVGISDFYIHCDAALFGGYLPFLDPRPKVDFELPIDSLAISGYKFIGSPFPCGLLLTRREAHGLSGECPEYIASPDTTISGSRNGHAPLVLWHAIRTRGREGLESEAQACVENAAKFCETLSSLNYPCYRNPFSNIVVLKRPSPKLVEKWRLISEGDWSHIVVMQHVTEEKFDAFLSELESELN